MDIALCKEFVVLSELGNFSKAADALYISQSSLSKHMKTLEREFGCELLKRTPHGVAPNEYGATFLHYARQIAQLHHQCTSALDNQRQQNQHVIDIGSISVTTSYNITELILEFKRTNRNYSVNLIEGEPDELKNLLRSNRVELAFVREEGEDNDEFARIPYTSDTVAAILPRYHPLALNRCLSFEDLRNEEFLLLQPGSLLYSSVLNECRNAGFTPRISYTGQHADSIINLVEKGMGISLLMKRPLAYLENPKIAIVDIEPEITMNISLYYLKGTALSDAAKRFIDMVVDKLES